MYELVIRNGMIVDGTGKAGYRADIALRDGVVALIRNEISDAAEAEIDAKGLIIAPGFIDNHSHSDLLVLCDNSGYNMLEQGITTEITGMCGLGIAPASRWLSKYIGAEAVYGERMDLLMSLTSHAKLFEKVNEAGTGTNMAFYIAQGTVRIAVMGFDNRKPADEELEIMKDMVREGMENGAIGLSTGLIYPPGAYTTEDEIVELCRIVASYGGVYCSHIRNESQHVVEAVREAIRIGEKTKIPVILSHHKIIGKNNWGKSGETLRLIEEAGSKGLEVCADMYPYTAGATFLKSALPPRYASQGAEALLGNLKEKAFRQEVREFILKDENTFENLVMSCGFENIHFTMSGKPEADGKSIAGYAAETGQDPFDTMFDLLVGSEGKVFGIFTMMSDEDMERIMTHPSVMFGTDGTVIVRGVAGVPRAYGTYPRILGRYVREKKLLGVEEAVRKMTSMPAARAGLQNKGLIKQGYDADLVIFNPETITDRSDIGNAAARNEGLSYVIVNGKIAVKDNVATGVKAGRVIRRR